jgi:DNA-binding transcriptional LysR family regulator
MTILQIDYFLAVAECGGFTQAAQKIFVSQPTITQQVTALEHELGFRLFDRFPRKVTPTPAGRIMMTCFLRFREDFDESRSFAERLASGIGDKLNVGFLALTGMNEIAARIHESLSGLSGVSVEIARAGLDKLCTRLHSGKLDIAFFYDDQLDDPAGFRFDFMFASEYKIVIAKTHPLAKNPKLCVKDLIDEPFIVYRTLAEERHRRVFRKLGLGDVRFQTVSDYEAVFTMVGGNFGAAVSDARNTLLDGDQFVVLDTDVYHNMCAVRTKDNASPLAESLVRMLTESCGAKA